MIRSMSLAALLQGEGSVTWATKCGTLCGSGEMSMASQYGEDEGMGGVVASSTMTGGESNCAFHKSVSQPHIH